jgi:hypothetical protein
MHVLVSKMLYHYRLSLPRLDGIFDDGTDQLAPPVGYVMCPDHPA